MLCVLAAVLSLVTLAFYANYVVGFTIIESFGLTATIITNTPSPLDLSKNFPLSFKTLFLASNLTGFVVYAHYASDLTAVMTSGTPQEEISSFADVISGGFDVVVVESTAEHDFLKRSRIGTAMQNFYTSNMRDKGSAFVEDFSELVDVLRNRRNTLVFSSTVGFINVEGLIFHKTTDGLHGQVYWFHPPIFF